MIGAKRREQWETLALPELRDQVSATLRRVDVAVTVVALVAVLAVVILAVQATKGARQ